MLLWRYSNTGIFHRYLQLSGFVSARNSDLAFLGELRSVADKVIKNLSDSRGIPNQLRRQCSAHFNEECISVFRHLTFEQRCNLLHQIPNGEFNLLQADLAGLDLQHVQDIVENDKQRFRGLRHDCHVLLLPGIELRVLEHLHHADDAVHGRSYLVAHVCQKRATLTGNALIVTACALCFLLRCFRGGQCDFQFLVHLGEFSKHMISNGLQEGGDADADYEENCMIPQPK